MIESARKIVEQQHGEFDPKEFTDRYEDQKIEQPEVGIANLHAGAV